MTKDLQKELNIVAVHPLGAFEWGEFRKKTEVKVIQKIFLDNENPSGFQLTIHKIPHTNYNIGYLPKGTYPDQQLIDELVNIGKKENCIFIQLEPNIEKAENQQFKMINLGLRPSTRPLFTPFTFQLDLRPSEEELLKNMHSKTRYNIKVAQKYNVRIIEDNSNQAFEEYLKLMNETTKRQSFHAHDKKYHQLMWNTLKVQNLEKNKLTAHLFLAKYANETLVAWIIFVFKDTLYYPYGASSIKHREVMASNLMMWEVIKFGKRLGLKKFDMWGALGPNPDKNDPWFGFHRFKEGYGGKLVEFVGSYDLVISPFAYEIYKIADKIRWQLLKIKKLLKS